MNKYSMQTHGIPLIFPWREGNTLKFHLDGDRFYPAMLGAVNQAKQFVLMEMYLFESGKISNQFIEAFVNAAQRGIKLYILADDYGAKALSRVDRERLMNAGIELVFYNPIRWRKFKNNLKRTHRKILIIDGEILFVGGAGITDYFHGDDAWRETVVEVSGRVVADWHELFANNFKSWTNTSVPQPVIKNNASASDMIRARLVYTSGGSLLEIKKVLLNRMNNSHQSIWFATAYFIPSRKIRKAIRRAANRGIEVLLLLPGPITDHPSVRYASRRYYARLLRYGVRIFEYQGRFTHTKMILIDDWLTIGSSNMDRWNFRWNLEANLEVEHERSVKEARDIMARDFANCVEITYSEWVKRSKLQQFKEWLWGRADIFLTRYL